MYQLIRRDISVCYRQSALSYAWALIVPLVTVLFFTYLTSRRVLPIGVTPIPYPAFAIWNLILWQLFASSFVACTHSLTKAGALVTKINFPKETLIISAVGQPIFDFLIKLVLVTIIFVLFSVVPSPKSILVIFILIPVLLLAVGFGFLFAVINLVLRDVGTVVGMMATYGMFAAPILYPPPVTSPFYLINILNPFSPLLIATQDLIIHGEIMQDEIFWCSVVLATLVFLLGWRIFRLVLPKVVERA